MHAHTGREPSAHKKTWSAHKCSFQKLLLHIYFIPVVSNIDETWLNVAQRKFYAYTDLNKLEGTLLITYPFFKRPSLGEKYLIAYPVFKKSLQVKYTLHPFF